MISELNKRAILKYIMLTIFYICLICFVLYKNFYTITDLYQENASKTITKTINEYNEIDLQHLCAVVSCTEIGIIDESRYVLIDNILRNEKYKKPANFITNDLDIIIREQKYNVYAILDTNGLIHEILYGYARILELFSVIFTLAFIVIEFKERRRKMLDMMSTSNSLREKNMQILTENIHHELNTPVAIIQGNIKMLEISTNTQKILVLCCL